MILTKVNYIIVRSRSNGSIEAADDDGDEDGDDMFGNSPDTSNSEKKSSESSNSEEKSSQS